MSCCYAHHLHKETCITEIKFKAGQPQGYISLACKALYADIQSVIPIWAEGKIAACCNQQLWKFRACKFKHSEGLLKSCREQSKKFSQTEKAEHGRMAADQGLAHFKCGRMLPHLWHHIIPEFCLPATSAAKADMSSDWSRSEA